MSTPKNPHALKQFIIALVIVLTGVYFGSMLALKKADADLRQRTPQRQVTQAPASKGVPTNPGQIQPREESGDFSWTNDMVWIPAGSFLMGSTNGQPDEVPVHEVELSGFWMDKHEVTNAKFKEFADASNYQTLAERIPTAADFPGVPPEMIKPEMLVPGSIVFTPPNFDVNPQNHGAMWSYVKYACWKTPEGQDSNIKDRMDHPAVHITWEDAVAYSRWANKRLPSEAEWEYAARAGQVQKFFIWGDEEKPGGKWPANVFQGRFPYQNTVEDGYPGTSPVGKFPANAFGLHDMAGNVWEWCNDWYLPNYYRNSDRKDPKGPDDSYDPNEPGVKKKVNRGGSFLSHPRHVAGYRPGLRMKTSTDTALSHTGFRCVKTGPSPEEIAKILAAKTEPKS